MNNVLRALGLTTGVMPKWSKWVEQHPFLDFLDTLFRGLGQVCEHVLVDERQMSLFLYANV